MQSQKNGETGVDENGEVEVNILRSHACINLYTSPWCCEDSQSDLWVWETDPLQLPLWRCLRFSPFCWCTSTQPLYFVPNLWWNIVLDQSVWSCCDELDSWPI